MEIKCPLCRGNFSYAIPLMIRDHLRTFHGLVSSCEVLARAMFLSPVGYEEALNVLKDFDRRDQRYRDLELNIFTVKKNKCNKLVQTIDKEIVAEMKNKVKKFEEIWEGKLINNTKLGGGLNVEETKIFEDLEKILDSQNKEIAQLKSQLILSKEDITNVISDEIDRLKEVIGGQKITLTDLEEIVVKLKSSNNSKDEEIVSLKVQNERIAAFKNKLSLEKANLKHLLEVSEKDNELILKKTEVQLENALKLVKTVEEKESRNHPMQKSPTNSGVEPYVALRNENCQNMFDQTKKSVNDFIEMNAFATEKIIEAVSNTKAACKYMVKEVQRQFENFEAETSDINVLVETSSCDSKYDFIAAKYINKHGRGGIDTDAETAKSYANNFDASKNPAKVVDYDSEGSGSSDEVNNNSSQALKRRYNVDFGRFTDKLVQKNEIGEAVRKDDVTEGAKRLKY